MGKFFSKEITHSIGVSGNHNYVLLLNGVPINMLFILNDITNNIVKDNQKMIIYATIILIIIILLLTTLIVSAIVSYYMRYYQAYWELRIQGIIFQLRHIKLIIQKNNKNISRCPRSTKKASPIINV